MRKWFENYWYHNKWKTLIALFFIVTAIICAVQLLTRPKYDVYVVYVGNAGYVTGDDYQDILTSLTQFASDVDGNGEVSVNFSRETFISDVDDPFSSSLNSNIGKFMQSALISNYYVFIIDPVLYEEYKDSGLFVDLSDHVGDIPDEMIYDSKAIKLSSCKAYTLPGMSSVQKDALIVLKEVPYAGVKGNPKGVAAQSSHAELIQKIIDYGTRQ